MKKTMKFFGGLFVLGSLVAFNACTNKEEIEGNGQGVNRAVFSLETVDVGPTNVTVKATATGAEGATYFGFLTDDLTSDLLDLLNAKLKGVTITRHILSSGTTEFEETGLRPGGKEYRYVLAGLLANGTQYNDPISINFKTKGDFTTDSEGVISYPDPVSDPTGISFEGFPGKYYYGFMTAEEFAATNIADIVNSTLDGSEAVASEGDQKVNLSISEEGEYVVYAFEIDENGYPTLKYKTLNITIGSLDFSDYEAFLGSWYVNGVEDDIIKIEELKRGVSYTVSGSILDLPESITSIEAAFVNSDKTFVINEQVLEEYEHNSYGPCWRVYGGFSGGEMLPSVNLGSGSQVVVSGAIGDDGNIILTPGSFSEEGEEHTFDGMGYYWVILTGDYAGLGNWNNPINLPNKFTKEPAEPTEDYKAWLGSWWDENSVKYEIKAYKTNTSYLMSGWDMAEEEPFDIVVGFDEATCNLVFNGYVIGEDSSAEYDFCGITSNGYINYNGILAKGVMADDKKTFTISGNTGTNKDGEYVINSLGIYTYTSGWGYYNNANIVNLPASFTNEEPSPKEAYLAWLGDWEIVRDETNEIVDTWTVAEKKTNSSFTVTGIEGTSFEVEALFDNATGALTIAEQPVYELVDDNEKNIMSVFLFGNFMYNGELNYWGNKNTPVVLSATIKEDGTATVNAGCPYEPYIPYYGYFVSFNLYAALGNSSSLVPYSDDFATPLPNKLTPSSAEPTATRSLPIHVEDWKGTPVKHFSGITIPATQQNNSVASLKASASKKVLSK